MVNLRKLLMNRRWLSSAVMETAEVDCLVIGAGVIGLSVAERLSRRQSTLVVERNSRFGCEISSRNSEVIHNGIYYPNDSLKTRMCIRGRHLLYELCKRAGIPHRQIGKWIVAVDPEQAEQLNALHAKATNLGVATRFISKAIATNQEPNVVANTVLESPLTGIIDSHSYMQYLENRIMDHGNSDVSYNSKVVGIEYERHKKLYRVGISYGKGIMVIKTPALVNAAGLGSERIAKMLLPETDMNHLKLHFCKGHYFAYRPSHKLVSRLIYPMPEKNLRGLGIHCTVDMAGRAKFGPDVSYMRDGDELSYEFTSEYDLLDKFCGAIKKYIPSISKEDLIADYTGIRPKLQGPNDGFRDFIIDTPKAFPGFVNLVGIESPGLTASQAIAEYVYKLI